MNKLLIVIILSSSLLFAFTLSSAKAVPVVLYDNETGRFNRFTSFNDMINHPGSGQDFRTRLVGWDGFGGIKSSTVPVPAPVPVPEPATTLLIVTGLIGLAATRRKFKKKSSSQDYSPVD